jgi:hypothetical protein|tara:strand:- start:14889 stop:15077 length:189 start_codon:yes stop_codon:yes gene_type:complete
MIKHNVYLKVGSETGVVTLDNDYDVVTNGATAMELAAKMAMEVYPNVYTKVLYSETFNDEQD